jgi:hypothetical protein
MRCPFVLRFIVSGLLALAIVASITRGQTAGTGGVFAPPLVFYATRYLSDERLHKELKLTPEQVKKVTALVSGSPPFFAGIQAEQIKAREKELAEILKPEQVKRLKEVLYQQMERIPVGPLVLAGDDAIGKALQLTDDQKARMRARESLADVLTDGQKKEWKKLQGEPFTGRLQMGPLVRTVAAPGRLQYLGQNPVRIDLKLTEKQQAGVEALQKEWDKTAPQTRFVGGSEEAKKAAARVAEFEKKADELLDAGQVKRLDQIILQQAFTNGRESDVFTHARVVAELKMDEKQQARIRAARDERQQGLLSVFARDEAVADIARQVKEHKKETYKQLHALLSPEQEACLKAILGEPFKGEISLRAGGIGGFPTAPFLTVPIYLVMPGLTLYASSEALHKELKLTKEQIAKLLQLQTKARSEIIPITPFPTNDETEKKRKAQAESMEKDLAAVLSKEQMKRFKQLILQTYVNTNIGAGFAVPAALRNRTLTRLFEVQQGLKLSEEQKQKLQAGAEIDKLLDAGQLARWKEQLGEPFEGNLRPTFARAGPGFRQRPTLALQALETKRVQAELKLTEKHIEAVRELEKKYQEKMTSAGNGQDFLKQIQAAQAELDAGCKKLLDAGQAKRLDEIILQHAYRNGLNALLLQPVA